MEIATDAAGTVVQYGEGIGLPDGCTLHELSADQALAFQAICAGPHGDLTFDGSTFGAQPLPATPPPSPLPNANKALIDKLNALTLTAGGEADMVRQAVVSLLLTQPPVPAV